MTDAEGFQGKPTEHPETFLGEMSTKRSILAQRIKETIGISKGTYDEEMSQGACGCCEIDDCPPVSA